MRDKGSGRAVAAVVARSAGRRRRIRADLESKGVAPEFSQPVADRLAEIVPDFSSAEYGAVLDGVAAAFGVHQREFDPAGDVQEIEHLMDGFANELRKLEEGLRILSAYVHRMRTRATRGSAATLH
ncbi:MAG: hypothetical protein OEM05_16025 [Myxococcales bacterium]|nr:hypothetical protein [Myxococcales bacterium]